MLNIQIQTLINEYERIQTQQLVKGKTVSINSITNQKKKNGNESFIDFVEGEVEKNQTITEKTKVSHRNMLNKLKEELDRYWKCLFWIAKRREYYTISN